jgi:hypothetical protein
MTRPICLAAMFAVVAGVWAATPTLHAASWPVTALATEYGAIVTQAMGRREGRCPRGKVYDKERGECVRIKKELKKETTKEPKKEPK